MNLQERYTVVQTLLDQERIRMAQQLLRNIQTRSAEEAAVMGKAQRALDEFHMMLDVR